MLGKSDLCLTGVHRTVIVTAYDFNKFLYTVK